MEVWQCVAQNLRLFFKIQAFIQLIIKYIKSDVQSHQSSSRIPL